MTSCFFGKQDEVKFMPCGQLPGSWGQANSEDKAVQALGSLPREEVGCLLPTNSNSETER